MQQLIYELQSFIMAEPTLPSTGTRPHCTRQNEARTKLKPVGDVYLQVWVLFVIHFNNKLLKNDFQLFEAGWQIQKEPDAFKSLFSSSLSSSSPRSLSAEQRRRQRPLR